MNKVTIKFYGGLAQFGDSFTLYADTVNDAIRSLVMQIDGLKDTMKKGFYNVKVDDNEITEDEYISTVKAKDGSVVHITPKVKGAGKIGSFIAGAVLTAVGMFTGFTPLIQIGVGLMIGGVAQMLVKQPSFNSDYEGVEDSHSSAFTSLSNMVGQGKQIPRVYGNIRVGSVVISQGMSSYRVGDAPKKIQEPVYKSKFLNNLEAARDPEGRAYNTDTGSDSVKNAQKTISVDWE